MITGMVQAWFWAGSALHPEGLDPATARALFDIAQYWGPVINGATMTMAVSFIPLALGASPPVPKWLGWLSIIFFLEQGIETVMFGESGFFARRREPVSRRHHRHGVGRRGPRSVTTCLEVPDQRRAVPVAQDRAMSTGCPKVEARRNIATVRHAGY
ncbi:MAG: hypothetical protein R2716_09760 [Microthrixaceae bacterium]